ncbi:MAG: TrkA family potassium uptake protein [Planctomycetota bacterium]
MSTRDTYAVLGLSRFGYHVATKLFDQGRSVIAVDRDEALVHRIAPEVTKAVQADATDFEVLEHVGALDVDTVIIAFRSAFDATVLLAHYLRNETDVRRIVAQVNTARKGKALRVLGVHKIVNPERDMADRVVRELTIPGLVEKFTLGANAAIADIGVPKDYVGKSLVDLDLRQQWGIYVIGIRRESPDGDAAAVSVVPPPETVFEDGDHMIVFGTTDKLDPFTQHVRKSR